MAKKITGSEYPLLKIFSSDFDYHIPNYQRPYAWTTQETETLFDDLYGFYCDEEDDNYFLGSIVLIKEDDNPHSEVIDGQQRLTTLTILLAAIASKFDGELRDDYREYIREKGRPSQGLPSMPRLHLRSRDQEFFEKHIQSLDLDSLKTIDVATLDDEAKKHIKENCDALVAKIDKAFDGDVKALNAFGNFLVQRCYLVAVYTSSKSSAFRVFSVMNSRGLDLLPIDLIKAETIDKLPAEYTDKWEELEVQASRSGFNDVFVFTRMIFAKSKPKKELLEEFKTHVLSKVEPKELIDGYLEPYTDAYCMLKGSSYISSSNAEEVNNLLKWLNKIDNSDWMPVAIKFFAEHGADPEYIYWFTKRLERLAAFLLLTQKDINKRIERYATILLEMDERPKSSLDTPLTSIELSPEEINDFKSALDGDIYLLTSRRRNYAILRLDSFIANAGGATYDYSILTIEHVLPQTVNPESDWASTWPDADERKQWLNRIGNLVPLTRRRNSKAQNYDFDVKKQKYFSGNNGASSYVLTSTVLKETEWTPAVVKARQKSLMEAYAREWSL